MPWPKDLKAQLWAFESLAKAFKGRGRYRDSLAHHLDLLADLGRIVRVETPEGPRWHRPQALGA